MVRCHPAGPAGGAGRADRCHLPEPRAGKFPGALSQPRQLRPPRRSVAGPPAPRGLAGFRQCGAHPALLPATLRRGLRQEGRPFQAIKDELRRRAAEAALAAGTEAIPDLAARLGYAETSAFHRAFRKWTGLAPGSFRAQRQA
ncbi:helix-turn-helix domain-containing protein [Nitrospirillum sp. BR 11752]|uniref:helix-turn-helix domain-containing protein n=1 Tax=Nitrospirillum sp. BR 11752 TaxID=3104293 RepID=UPI003FA528E2